MTSCRKLTMGALTMTTVAGAALPTSAVATSVRWFNAGLATQTVFQTHSPIPGPGTMATDGRGKVWALGTVWRQNKPQNALFRIGPNGKSRRFLIPRSLSPGEIDTALAPGPGASVTAVLSNGRRALVVSPGGSLRKVRAEGQCGYLSGKSGATWMAYTVNRSVVLLTKSAGRNSHLCGVRVRADGTTTTMSPDEVLSVAATTDRSSRRWITSQAYAYIAGLSRPPAGAPSFVAVDPGVVISLGTPLPVAPEIASTSRIKDFVLGGDGAAWGIGSLITRFDPATGLPTATLPETGKARIIGPVTPDSPDVWVYQAGGRFGIASASGEMRWSSRQFGSKNWWLVLDDRLLVDSAGAIVEIRASDLRVSKVASAGKRGRPTWSHLDSTTWANHNWAQDSAGDIWTTVNGGSGTAAFVRVSP